MILLYHIIVSLCYLIVKLCFYTINKVWVWEHSFFFLMFHWWITYLWHTHTGVARWRLWLTFLPYSGGSQSVPAEPPPPPPRWRFHGEYFSEIAGNLPCSTSMCPYGVLCPHFGNHWSRISCSGVNVSVNGCLIGELFPVSPSPHPMMTARIGPAPLHPNPPRRPPQLTNIK